MNVYIGGTKDYSAMRGPCASGFHVPSKDEWQSLYDAGVSDGAWTSSGGNNFKTYLKLPINGYSIRTGGGIENRGTYGKYWTADRYSGDSAYCLQFTSSEITPQSSFSRATGENIRPFKDNPVEPDSSWTALYSDKIYHNSTLGLISIKNGSNWITIADKNLGATAVYNNGDTLSEANCGKYYQRGNNYGFPFSGSGMTTATSLVDASVYGPGNYYSSSTFIVRTSSPYRWDSGDNANLWGGVTGVVSPAVLKNAYIGQYS